MTPRDLAFLTILAQRKVKSKENKGLENGIFLKKLTIESCFSLHPGVICGIL